MRVAYVERNVFRSNFSEFSAARSATALHLSNMLCSRLPVGEGNTKRSLWRWGRFSSNLANSTGIGISLSSQRLGENPKWGLEVTRIVLSLRLMSLQNRNATSYSRNPVSRKVEKSSLSRSVVTSKKDASSSSVYSNGNGDILSGR